jgi:hypothetical protein
MFSLNVLLDLYKFRHFHDGLKIFSEKYQHIYTTFRHFNSSTSNFYKEFYSCKNLCSLLFSGHGIDKLCIPETFTKLKIIEIHFSDIQELNIPESCVNLQSIICYSTNNLRLIKIPHTLTKLYKIQLQTSTTQVREIIIPETLVNLRIIHISGSKIKNLYVPETITNLKYLTIIDNCNLTEVRIPKTLINLEHLICRNNRNLLKLHIPDTLINLKKIIHYSNGFKEVFIPDTLKNIILHHTF